MERPAQLALALVACGCGGNITAPVLAPPPVPPECRVYDGYHHPFTPTGYPIEVVIDTHASNANIALILDAMDAWNERLQSEVLFATITEDLYGMHGGCNFATVTTTTALPQDDVGLTQFGPCASNHVAVRVDFTEQEIRNIAAHELGHVLGAPHDEDDRTSVMYPKLRSKQSVISERSSCIVKIAIANSQTQ